ncbi:hypothetical protein FOCC_FOCC005256, partial [Frankliniella occidentalis]
MAAAPPVQRPGPLNVNAQNLEAEWIRFQQKFEVFLIGARQTRATSKEKWALLLGEAGDDALEVYNGFKEKLAKTARQGDDGAEIIEDMSQDYETVVAEFKAYATERKSITACRYEFNQRNQKGNETVSAWLTALRNLVKYCDYGTLEDSMVRDRLIWGSRYRKVRESMKAKSNVNLLEVIEYSKSIETASKNAEEAAVDTVSSFPVTAAQRGHGNPRYQHRGKHPRGRGGPRGRGAYRGGRKNNYSFRGNGRGNKSRGGVHARLGYNNHEKAGHKIECTRCGRSHEMYKCPAYGSQCSTCGGYNHWASMCRTKNVAKPEASGKNTGVNTLELVRQQAQSEHILDSFGIELAEVEVHTTELDDCIMDVETAQDDEVIDPGRSGNRPAKLEYTETLRIQGKHYIRFKLDPGSEANIIPMSVFSQINANNNYKVYPCKTKLKGFGNVVSSVEGQVRFRTETKHGDQNTFEYLITQLECPPILGIVACAQLNLVVRVNHTKDVLTVISKGRQWPTTTEQLINQNIDLFTGLGTFKHEVKILVDPAVNPGISPARRYSYSITQKLKPKLEELEKAGIIAKVQGEQPKFVSNLVVREKPNGDLRLCLDPEILNTAIIRQRYAIPSLDEISCKLKDKTVFSVLDLKDGFWHATLDKDSSLLCSFSTPHVHFQWLPIHTNALDELKDSVCQAPALIPFDGSKPMVVQADASQMGIGACLYQEGRPVSSSSRKLTETEQSYAQIEKEMLALTFAANRFDKFIYGMPNVLFQTDHQPLVAIFKKPLHKITNSRLKTMRIKLLKYNPTVEYLPGKYMFLADLLSREYLDDPVDDDPEMIEVVHEVTAHLPMSSEVKQEFVSATAEDKGLQAVAQYYQHGWPPSIQKAVPESHQYWNIRNDLFTENGMVVLEDKVVVPEALRQRVLTKLHIPHLGIDKTKARARQVVYWPGITNDITQLITGCRICERYSNSNFKGPLLPHAIPERRYQKVSCDILDHKGQPYLVIEDNYSKWLEVQILKNKSSQAVINVLRNVFSTHGIPEVIYGDNNPLNSAECRTFASSLDSSIETSSPEYPQSNGLAEKGVGIARKLLDKCTEDRIHLADALREYNNTPLTGTPYSPAQILMSRMCRTMVPTLASKLEPRVVDMRPIWLKHRQKAIKKYNRYARRGPVRFAPNDPIVFRKGRKWFKGHIVRKHEAPRSYIIRQLNGRQLRRTTFHLKPSRTQPDMYDTELDDIDLYFPCSQQERQEPPQQQTAVPQINPGLGNPPGPPNQPQENIAANEGPAVFVNPAPVVTTKS